MPLTAFVAVAFGTSVLIAVAGVLLVREDRRRIRRSLAPLARLSASSAAFGEDGGPGAGGAAPRDALASVDALVSAVEAELERSRRESAAATSGFSRLAEALSAVPEGVVVCDERGEIRFRNEVAQ